MSNKCLVTRLKAAIQNDDLPLFDTVKFEVISSTSTKATNWKIGFAVHDAEEGIVVKVDGNGYFATAYADLSDETKRMTQTTISSATTIIYLYFASGPYNVYVSNAHNIKDISIEGANESAISCIKLDLTELRNSNNLLQLRASQGRVSGAISNVPSTMNDLMLRYCQDVYGNINDIAYKCIFSERLWIHYSGITGRVEDLVAGQVSQGVDTYTSRKFGNFGSIRTGKNLTFGGTTPTVEFHYFSWSGTSRIIAADVTPIENATTIYAKGATSSEISAWEAAGKTVVVITDDGE